MPLVFTDQSGPETLAQGRRILDLEKNGTCVATIEYSGLAGEYVLCAEGCLTADELAQVIGLMMKLNEKYKGTHNA